MGRRKKENIENVKKEIIVFSSANWELKKDGVNVIISSGSGFYNEERDNANVELKITVEEL